MVSGLRQASCSLRELQKVVLRASVPEEALRVAERSWMREVADVDVMYSAVVDEVIAVMDALTAAVGVAASEQDSD